MTRLLTSHMGLRMHDRANRWIRWPDAFILLADISLWDSCPPQSAVEVNGKFVQLTAFLKNKI